MKRRNPFQIQKQFGDKISGEYGRHIPKEKLFSKRDAKYYSKYSDRNLNPYYPEMMKQYIENIYDTQHHNFNGNFGATQIVGGPEMQSSDIKATRSKGDNIPDWLALLDHNRVDEYGNKERTNGGTSIFDSERTGLQEAYNDYVLKNRQNDRLLYNPRESHSINNLRRTVSPDPQRFYEEQEPEDLTELEGLQRLSSVGVRYGPTNQSFAKIIQQGLKKDGSTINMLSERPACNYPGEGGCSQFLPTVMPAGSNYGYTQQNDGSYSPNHERDILFNAYNANTPQYANDADAQQYAKGGSVTQAEHMNSRLAQLLQILINSTR